MMVAPTSVASYLVGSETVILTKRLTHFAGAQMANSILVTATDASREWKLLGESAVYSMQASTDFALGGCN